MKLLKHLDTRNNKVMLGLFSLLFVVTAVHTNAILRMTTPETANQSAQVSLANNNCIQVNPGFNYTRVYNSIELPQNSTPYFKVTTTFFNIKNVCPYDVYIIGSQSLNRVATPEFSHVYTSLQKIGWQNQPETITIPSNLFGQPSSDFMELLEAYGTPSPIEIISPNVATSANGRLASYKIEPNQTIDFILSNKHPYNPNSPVSAVRVSMNKLKWFNQSAAQDNIIVPKEVRTYNFPASLQQSMASDVLDVFSGCDCVDDGENIKLDTEKLINSPELEKFIELYKKEKSPALQPSSSLR